MDNLWGSNHSESILSNDYLQTNRPVRVLLFDDRSARLACCPPTDTNADANADADAKANGDAPQVLPTKAKAKFYAPQSKAPQLTQV